CASYDGYYYWYFDVW
nr:immunoglobulin heavy chain junction region [Mus musculus]MBK4188810.1 immunoglobulin heavy chain junction region [Mus musculus]MBK4188811.1 immunoglobulin heavy chain junction region [Mus musculus]MBK4188812.1 immunoglobulin heavy chain junction region [Mus musculus]